MPVLSCDTDIAICSCYAVASTATVQQCYLLDIMDCSLCYVVCFLEKQSKHLESIWIVCRAVVGQQRIGTFRKTLNRGLVQGCNPCVNVDDMELYFCHNCLRSHYGGACTRGQKIHHNHNRKTIKLHCLHLQINQTEPRAAHGWQSGTQHNCGNIPTRNH